MMGRLKLPIGETIAAYESEQREQKSRKYDFLHPHFSNRPLPCARDKCSEFGVKKP